MYIQRMHVVQDQADDTLGGGGSTEPSLDESIDSTVDSLAADLGLKTDGSSGSAAPSPDGTSATGEGNQVVPPAPDAAQKLALDNAKKVLGEKKVDITGKTDAELLELVKQHQPPEPVAAPKSWKKEMHEFWGKLTPDVQKYVLQRETEFETGIKSYAESARYGKTLSEVLTPYQPLLTAQGVDHPTAVKYLMNAHYQLSSGDEAARTRYFAQLAKSYQVDPAKIVQAAGEEPPYQDPKVSELEKRMGEMEAGKRKEMQDQYEAAQQRVTAEVTAFRDAKDDKGQLKHPHFDDVAMEVSMLLQDPRITLDEAYDRAVYANPVTRAKELGKQRETAAAEIRRQAEEEARKAREKNSEVRGSRHRSPSSEPLGSIDNTMEETLKAIRAREAAKT